MTGPVARGRAASATTARTVAQAKINLFLRVLAREATGYHQLETLFCRIDLGDDVRVRTRVRGRSLDATGDAMPAAGLGAVHRNLAWRAAEAFSNAAGWPNDWAIEIEKRIPVGGGLGGGSADAGAVLRCLNALAPSPLQRHALLGLAASVGADVPFLTLDEPLALAWGRGDRLVPLPALPRHDVALACFPFGVSTPDAFTWLDDAHADVAAGASAVELGQLVDWAHVARLAHNDFEAVVAPHFPAIAATLAAWRSRATQLGDAGAFALLTGSGSTVFLTAEHVPSDIASLPDASVRVVQTATATRVVDVELSD